MHDTAFYRGANPPETPMTVRFDTVVRDFKSPEDSIASSIPNYLQPAGVPGNLHRHEPRAAPGKTRRRARSTPRSSAMKAEERLLALRHACQRLGRKGRPGAQPADHRPDGHQVEELGKQAAPVRRHSR